MKHMICKLLDISEVSYYRWKKDRLIIPFLEQYFTKDDLDEYIKTNKVKKLELIKDYTIEELEEKLNQTIQNEDSLLIDFVKSNIADKLNKYNLYDENILIRCANIYNKISNSITVKNAKELTLNIIESNYLEIDISPEKPQCGQWWLYAQFEKFSSIEIYVIITNNTTLFEKTK